ncbi:MAG: MFS transporter [Pseudomonadota bacterium]
MAAVSAVTDRHALYLANFLRALATSMLGVMLGLYLARLDFAPAQIGAVISVGLLGAAAASLLTMLAGDRIGRRRLLLVFGSLSALGGIGVALGSTLMAVGAAAFVGMLNGMGKDRGAQLVLEQAILPSTGSDADRTRTFAWYHVLQDSGHALGGLLAAAPDLLERHAGMTGPEPYRWAMLAYVLLTLASTACYLRLTPAAEPSEPARPLTVHPESRRILWKISALFAIDSVSGGFFGAALLAYFFHEHFGASATAIAVLFLGARVMNALSHLGAAWLAGRIGLVNTMVFTHIPSSLLLVTMVFMPDFGTAAVLFLLREGLVEMDVPTRQSYLMAVVRPEERTFASALTHLVRVGGWAAAPSFAGALMQFVSLASPIFVGAALKIGYDVMLWFAFLGIKPPEERER